MSLTRWWERLRGSARSEPPATPAAPPTAVSLPASTPPAAAAPPAEVEPAEPAEALVEEPLAARNVRFFCWMVGVTPKPGAAAPPPVILEQMFLELDEIIASETQRAGLLPRAPHVVPQLMKTLRDEGYSSADVASRISKDVVLTAEVVRTATSALHRGDDDVEIDLARAVAVIGTHGLRRAIANVVLRPIFDARGDTLSARAATQIWKDADRKARLCSALAAEAGLDPFDGYLAGLLHNSGWTAVLRAIDGLDDIELGAAELAHASVVPAIVRRRDALFGALVGPWKLGAALEALAAEVGAGGLDAVQSPLGIALRDADRLAALRALAPIGQRPASSVPRWSSLTQPVQDCYAEIAAP